MKYKVSEIEGALLDAAVAKAEGHNFRIYDEADSPLGRPMVTAWPEFHDETSREQYEPSVTFGIGGPIIERERITLNPGNWDDSEWTASCPVWYPDGSASYSDADGRGATPLIAAMRAYVASKFGEEVELP